MMRVLEPILFMFKKGTRSSYKLEAKEQAD